AKQQTEIRKMEEELQSTQSYLVTLSDGFEHTRERLKALDEQIDGTPASKQLREAEAEKQRQDAIRKAANLEAKPIHDALQALTESVSNRAFPQSGFSPLVSFVQSQLSAALVGSYDVDWPKTPKAIATAITGLHDLAPLQAHVQQLLQDAISEKARL